MDVLMIPVLLAIVINKEMNKYITIAICVMILYICIQYIYIYIYT